MIVEDPNAFMRQLEAVGFYRLCAYWHPFRQTPDSQFKPGTSFKTVWRRYVFDRHLRLAMMDAIERIEVAVRTALVTELALLHGPFAHTELNNFPNVIPEKHKRFLDELQYDAARSKEEFVEHFKKNYDEFPDLPIWAAAETMTFGSMLTLFKMSERRIQSAVAKRFGIAGPVLLSWLLTLNYIRNICAHHSRLWNRELAIRPSVPDSKNGPHWHSPQPVTTRRIFVVLTLLNFMLRSVAPQTHWRDRLFEHFDRFSDIPLEPMGIPPDWREHALWTS